jgi:hypothetical protein
MVLLQGADSTSGGTAILVVASPGVWDRYAIGYLPALKSQYGDPVVLNDTGMAQKEALYKGALTTAAEIDTALKDNFDALVAAVKAIPATTGSDPAALAKAIWDENAKRIAG